MINQGKRRKILSEVKPVRNIIWVPQSFLEVSPVQNEVFPSQDHAYE